MLIRAPRAPLVRRNPAGPFFAESLGFVKMESDGRYFIRSTPAARELETLAEAGDVV